jgi:hypothetical protein
MPPRQMAQSQIPNPDAHQSLRAITKFLKHSPDFPVDSLLENDAQFRRPDLVRARRASPSSIKYHAAQEFLR